jgi:hypothetical protein
MTEVTYKPTLRSETSLSDVERALLGDFVSVQDIALSYRLDLNTFEIVSSGYIGARE